MSDKPSPALVDDEKLVERLRAAAETSGEFDLFTEAASRLQSLSAEVARLRAALFQVSQFQAQLDWIDDYGNKSNFATAVSIARAALSPSSAGSEK
jgi:hypothetical protein